MSLLLPTALLGLLTLPAIMLLHLLRDRRETRPISSLRLWRGLQQKQGGSRFRRIPLSVMLLLQLIVAAAISLALARPTLPVVRDQPRQTIFLLDTTTSMAATDVSEGRGPRAGVRRFDLARQAIQQHIESLGAGDTVIVIGLSARPKLLLNAEAHQTTQALAALDVLEPGGAGFDLSAALTLADGLVAPERLSQVVVLTDGSYVVDPDALTLLQVPVSWQLIPSPPAQDSANQALLSVSARLLPDGRHRLFARMVNYADVAVERTLQVVVDGQLSDESVVRLDPSSEAARVWTLPAKAETVAIELVEPDRLSLDNRADLFLGKALRHRVLLAADTPDLLARALEAQPDVELTVAGPESVLDQTSGFDLVVLNRPTFDLNSWPVGNLLVVDPPLGHPLLPANNYSRNLRPDLATASGLAADVDLSGVFFDRVPLLDLPDWADVDVMAKGPTSGAGGDGQPLIFHGVVDDSRIVVWAFDLAQSNLPARLALPLLTANTLSFLLTPALPPTVPLGESVLLRQDLSLEAPEGGRRSLAAEANPSTAGTGDAPVTFTPRLPGLYQVFDANDRRVAGFGVHAGSARESNLAVQFEPDTPGPSLDSIQSVDEPEQEQRELWPWIAGFTLAIVILEGWLAWQR